MEMMFTRQAPRDFLYHPIAPSVLSAVLLAGSYLLLGFCAGLQYLYEIRRSLIRSSQSFCSISCQLFSTAIPTVFSFFSLQGASAPIVIKFADSERERTARRLHRNMINFGMVNPLALAAVNGGQQAMQAYAHVGVCAGVIDLDAVWLRWLLRLVRVYCTPHYTGACVREWCGWAARCSKEGMTHS